MMEIQLWFNTEMGARCQCAYLPASLCKPKNLVAAAVAAGALFACCLQKYGGRQFCNPKYMPKEGRLA